MDLAGHLGDFLLRLRAIPPRRSHLVSVSVRILSVSGFFSGTISLFSGFAHRLIEALAPSNTSRPLTGGEDKRQKRENIERFLASCRAYGLSPEELFEVEDLLSMQDIPRVTKCLYTLGKHVGTFLLTCTSSTNHSPLSSGVCV